MANEFFEEIRDETDDLLGYKFKGNFARFQRSNDKYEEIDRSKVLKFEKLTLNNEMLESIFSGELRVLFDECSLRAQLPLTIENSEVTFKEGSSGTGQITFLNCKNSKIYIVGRNSNPLGNITVKNCQNLLLDFKQLVTPKINFKNCDKLELNGIRLNGSGISIEECFFEKFTLFDSTLTKLSFNNSNANTITLSGVKGSDISLFGNHDPKSRGEDKVYFYKYVHLLSCKFKSLTLNSFNKKNIKIERLEVLDTSDLTLSTLNIKTITFTGNEFSNILIFACQLKVLQFSYFRIKENFVFNIVDVDEGILEIDNAILKGVEMNPSFLDKFNAIFFRNSSIDGLTAYSFKPVSTEVIRNMKGELMDSVDFCRELNALMVAQNNKHYASVYRALELELRAKANDSSLSWFDKQVLNLNHWSNVHGTMPQKALVWIFVFMIFQFGIINLDLAIQSGIPYGLGLDFLKQNYSYFIKPFTFLTDVEGDYKPFGSDNMKITFSWWVKGFDFLYKIFYAYLLYQFIAAFRKFNK